MTVITASCIQVKKPLYPPHRLMRRQRQWKLKSDETIKKDNKNGTIFPIKDAPEELQNVVK